MGVEPRRPKGFRDSFFWHYVRLSYAARGQVWFIAYPVMLFQYNRQTPIVFTICLPPIIIGLGLLLNYIAWQTLGRVITRSAERQQLSNAGRAALAWSFWWRPLRKAKS